MKRFMSLFTVAAMLIFLFSVVPMPAAAVERSVSSNYDTLVNHIETNGVMDDDLGMKTIGFYVDSDPFITYFLLMNHPDGIAFDVTMIGTDSVQTLIGTGFILKKASNTLDVEFGIMLAQNDQLLDELTTTKSINRTAFTTDSTYTINTSSTYISSSNATLLFNSTLQMLCQFWDEYLGENLGFGLNGLGFTSYDGYMPEVCNHTYDNACDTSCNLCSEVRETSHSYGDWTETETGHQKVCSSCGDTQSGEHNWILAPGSYEATCKEEGKQWYTCTVCNAKKEVITPKTDDHSYGKWEKVDDQSHTHTCTICDGTETLDHNWGIGVVTQKPTEDTLGIITYTCDDCGAEKSIEVAYIPGDIDGNGVVEQDDAVYLLLHTMFGEEFYPVAMDADIDKDGAVTQEDAVYLLLHTMFGESFYPLN